MQLQTMPLRFRVWDREERDLIYGAEHAYDYLYPDTNPLCVYNFYELIEDERYIVSQDTGLKDGEGKRIFIGDILKWGNNIWKVLMYKGQLVMDVITKPPRFHLLFDICHDTEVIGNIWQIPELLEAE